MATKAEKPKSREYRRKQLNAAGARHGGKDHHSGVTKDSKKGGAGAGNWGKPGVDDIIREYDDEYSYSDNDDDFFFEVKEFAEPINEILHEFFLGADFQECAADIDEFVAHELRPRFVKKALHLSLDLRAYERELTSVLLAQVSGNVITREQVMRGFEDALYDLPETVIDVPQAVEMLSKFIARAILDEALPPIFLELTRDDMSSLAVECVNLANGLLNAPHFGPRLSHIWGPGDLCSVKRMIQECKELLNEYLTSNDEGEAFASLQKLSSPSFHPRFIRELVREGLEKGPASYDRLLHLLKRFYEMGAVSQYSIGKGFQIVYSRKNDFKLDFPKIDELLPAYMDKARALGLLPEKVEEIVEQA